MNGQIVFRRINRDMPGPWIGGLHWYVEWHSLEHDMAFPYGIAFVTAGPTMQFLDFILVADQERRNGIASELVAACKQKWPSIDLTDAISESGEAFMASLEPMGERSK